ncbi:MAG TPA: hypothetical protein VLB05_08415 [Dongiaceae bacterium]|jgi:hypothetical protein|nr:hypothetical protein [Dongiaceae bacterium]
MQNIRRKAWVYLAMVIWCAGAATMQLSTLGQVPIVQAPGINTTNAAEEAYCQRPEVRDKKHFSFSGELLFTLTPATNYWMCKQVVRQHNRDFALALLWIILPPALVLLALWFPPTFPSRRR